MMVMESTDAVGLRLRFGEATEPVGEPDIAVFSKRSATKTIPRREPFGVVSSGRRLRRSDPTLIFRCRTDYPIPSLGHGATLPDLSSWSLRPTLFGYVASVTPASRTSRLDRRATAWVLAACLPLVAAPTGVARAYSGPSTEVQRPKTAVPEAPGTRPDAKKRTRSGATSGTADPGSKPPVDEDAASGDEPQPPTLPDSDAAAKDPTDNLPEDDAEAAGEPDDEPADSELGAEPDPQPSSYAPDFDRGMTDARILDAAWEGVDGYNVELELKGGRTMVGRVSAVQRDTFTLIEAETGQILVMRKSGVVSLRVRIPPPLPTKNGTGMIVGGSILTTFGVPVFISGLVFLGVCPSCVSLHLPMLFMGGAGLGAGIPLIIAGKRRRARFERALEERSASPMLSRIPGGWTGGIRFRF